LVEQLIRLRRAVLFILVEQLIFASLRPFCSFWSNSFLRFAQAVLFILVEQLSSLRSGRSPTLNNHRDEFHTEAR